MADFKYLTQTVEFLADETVLIQARKKKTSFRCSHHNWFSHMLELDRMAVNLCDFIDDISGDAKIRPLTHVSLRDQVIPTDLMMCLAKARAFSDNFKPAPAGPA